MKIFAPLPGEYIASALKRGNELLGVKSLPATDFYIKPIPRIGYGISNSIKRLNAESREHQIFEFPEFLTKYNVAEEVLNNHTLHPLNAALGRSRAHTNPTPKVWMKMCPDCAEQDHEIHGSAYIHRRHVQASVQVCDIHGSKLLNTCPHCSIPLRRHSITKLGMCSQKQKFSKSSENSKRELNSPKHLYAKFIAKLLNYSGPMVKRDIADFLAQYSLLKYYAKELEYSNMNMDITIIIERELGLSVKNTNHGYLLDNNFPIIAFLGCRTAERYLDLLVNENARESLKKTVMTARLHWAQLY